MKNKRRTKMQKTAVCNHDLHSAILCQQQHNHSCKVLLKDSCSGGDLTAACKVLLKDSCSGGDLTTASPKFKSPFKCNFINSSLNGNFGPCDSHQILHNFTHVKEKLNKDIFRKKLLSNSTRATSHFIVPKSQPFLSGGFSEKRRVYPKNIFVENGSPTSKEEQFVSNRLTNGFTSGSNDDHGRSISEHRVVTSCINNGAKSDVKHLNHSAFKNQIVNTRLSNGFTSVKNGISNGYTHHKYGSNGNIESSRLPFSTNLTNGHHQGNNGFAFVNLKNEFKSVTCTTKLQNGNHCDATFPSDDAVKPFNKPVLVSENGISSPKFLNGHAPSIQDNKQSENSFSTHRKHVKLKGNNEKLDGTVAEIDGKPDYVYRSSQRLSFINNWDVPKTPNHLLTKKLIELSDTSLDLKVNRKQSVVNCRSKKMRSSPELSGYNMKHNSGSHNTETGVCKCEWHDCDHRFETVEHLTKHIKADHIHPARENDVFVCLWRNCKFLNQPSCSFQWLSKHVTSHCDFKPFKCVIYGCDMTFVTQNGLARHVPTHFNESRVRRACVMTSESSQKETLSKSTKRSSTPSLTTSSTIVDDQNKKEEGKKCPGKTSFERFLDQNISKRRKTGCNRKTSNTIKAKVQRATCNSANNSGYDGKEFRIQHQIIGRRITPGGSNEVLLAPTLHNIFPQQHFWFNANEFRKQKLTYVDVKMKDLSLDAKNQLYDKEHATKRRTNRRK